MKRVLLLLSLVCAGTVAFAAQHENVARGFQAGKSYAFGDLDTVNMFNGNVTLSIPIGQAFPLSTRFSYRFMLHYNSLVWDIEEAARPVVDPTYPGAVVVVTVSYADRRSNAGMGWSFGLGRLYPKFAMSNEENDWVYETAEGGEHNLYVNGAGWQTQDGSFVRMRPNQDGSRMLVELPNGIVQEFEQSPQGNSEPWRLREMHDLFPGTEPGHPYANWVHIDYEPRANGSVRWKITDSIQRTHYVDCKQLPYDTLRPDFVESVQLDGWGSYAPTYHFTYEETATARHPDDTDKPNTSIYTGGLTDHPIVQGLKQIKLTDGAISGKDLGYTFDMTYRWASGIPRGDSGVLQLLTLPTGGSIGWEQDNYRLPMAADRWGNGEFQLQTVYGVGRRTVTDPSRILPDGSRSTGTWRYVHGTYPVYDPPRSYDIPKDARTSVTDPAGNVTTHYFSVWIGDPFNGWNNQQYGLSASPMNPEDSSNFRFLSKREYQGSTIVKRDTWVHLVGDRNNSRVESTKVVYQDALVQGAKQYVQSDSDPTTWDSYGHYKRQTTATNIPGTSSRETYTEYTPSTASAWLLDLYSEQRTKELPDSAFTGLALSEVHKKFHFNPATGFLEWQRTMAGLDDQAKDVREVFTPDIYGNVRQHDIYGGDQHNADAATPRFRLLHTYASGVPATSRYQDPATGVNAKFFSADITVDSSTALVTTSRDPAGQATTFTYDEAGRIKTMQPPGGANKVEVDYTNASRSSTFTPATIHVTSGDIQAEQQFDGLGRLWREKSLLPDDPATPAVEPVWSVSETLRNNRGLTDSVSLPAAIPDPNQELAFHPSPVTKFSDYDAFGRARTIRNPDGNVVTMDYIGDTTTTRTSSVMTDEGSKPTTTIETKDAFGRLRSVIENSASLSERVQSLYAYGVGNALIQVATSDPQGHTQPRTFTYDGRGFLTAETHPESGTTTYQYDARGQAVFRKTPVAELTFKYDTAERLEQVFDGDRLLKEFHYDRDSVGSDYSTGKLDYAIRHNWINAVDTQVKETYFYRGRAGAVSSKRTTVTGATASTFEEHYTYDPAGAVESITYPACPLCSPAAPSLAVLNGYENGVLRQVGRVGQPSAFVGRIDYHPAGLWTAIQHTNDDGAAGPLDTQIPDPLSPSRPLKIEVTHFCNDLSISSSPASVSIAFGASTTLTATAAGATSWKWFANGQEIPGATSASLTVTPTATTTFFARASNGVCTVDSAPAVVTVGPNCTGPDAEIIVTRQPQPATAVQLGAKVSLAASAVSGQALSFQWYEGPYATPAPIEGATAATFTTPVLNASTRYWVKVTNGCRSVNSEYAVITVDPCSFNVQKKGPGDADFKDGTDGSDYIVESGLTGIVLEVRPQLLPNQEQLDYHYAWTGDPAATDSPTLTLSTPVTAPRTITVTVTGSRPGFSCQRVVTFVLGACSSPIEVQAGTCSPSARPEAYVRLGTKITLSAQVMLTQPLKLLAGAELDGVRFTWSDDRGNVIADAVGMAGIGQVYNVPATAAEVPKHLVLKVTGLGCQRTVQMPLIVLNEPPCIGCEDPCSLGPLRVNGQVHQVYEYTDREQVVLTPPTQFGVGGRYYEWHRVLSGVDEVVGIQESLPLQLIAPARYYFRGQTSDGQWRASASLAMRLVTSDPTVSIVPRSQSVASGSGVAISVNVAGATPTEYEWRIGDGYDLTRPIIGNGPTLELTVRHDQVFWCRVKVAGAWRLSPHGEVITTCTPTIDGTAVPHPQFVEKDGYTFIAAAARGKLTAMYWYERNPDGTKIILTSGLSSGVGFRPTRAVSMIGADLVDSCGTTGSLTETPIYLCVPTITQQPQSSVIANGTATTLTATATPAVTGQNVVTTWFDEADLNRTTPLATGATFTTPALAGGTTKSYVAEFDAQCTSGVHTTLRSVPAVVHACAAPVVAAQVLSLWSTNPSSPISLSLGVTGTDLTYQWYEGSSGDISKPLPSLTERDVTVRPTTTTAYWCRIKSENVCVTDTPATTVHVCSAPPVAAQPQSVRVFNNEPATLSVTVGGSTNTEPITFQWQKQVDGVWVDVAGANAATFTITAIAGTTLTYRVVVFAGVCSTSSSPATVTMCNYPAVVPAAQPQSFVVYNGTVTLRLPDLNPVEEKSVTWYRGASGDRSQPMRSGVGTNFWNDSGPVTTSAQYWAEFTNQTCVTRTETYTVRACIPEITTQPSSRTVPVNTPATVTVGTTPIAGQTFQWYEGQSGDMTHPVTGATSASLNVSPVGTKSYWCRVASACDVHVDSNAATLVTCSAPQISAITAPQSAAVGSTVQLSVAATGSELTYQWYRGARGDTANPLAQGTAPSVSVTINAPTTYWCRVTSQGTCITDSQAATIDVCTNPAITSQPASQPLFSGNSATMTVVASPAGVTYQWYTGTAGTTTSPISGATGASLTVQPASTTSYWVRVTNGGCTTNNATATVTACVLPQQVSASPAVTNVTSGQTVTLSLPPMTPAVDVNVIWYRGAPGVRTAQVASGLNASYTSAHTVSAQYWAEFTHNGCTSSTTAYAINVCKPVITAQPQSVMINSGQSTALSVTATGQGLAYQWYRGAAGDTSAPVAGATQSSYTAAPTVTTSYWVRISGCTTVDSAVATVSICQTPQITSQPASAIASANGATLTVAATGTDLTYEWYSGASQIAPTTASITVNPTVTTSYWVRVKGRCGTAVDSVQAMVSVAPSINTQPASASVTYGSAPTLSVVASGTLLSYQWYERVGGTASIIAGATAASYTTPAITTERRFFCRVKSGEAARDSNDAVLTVCPASVIVPSNTPTNVSGSLFSFKIYNPVAGETYQWYQGASGNTSISLGTGTALSVRPVATTQYWVRTIRAGCNADSTAVTATICVPAIVEQPQDAYVFSGTQKTLTVSATGNAPLSYQWYRGAAGDTSTPVGQGASYTFTATATATYWVRISNPAAGCSTNSVDSTAATVTVCQRPVITQQANSPNLVKNSAFTLTVTAEGDGLQYQWYRGLKGDVSAPVGYDECSLTATATSTQAYWVRVTGSCAAVDSETAWVSVYPVITQQPANASICALGSTATFSVTATGADAYTWYREVNSGPTEVVGSAATLSIPIAATPARFYVNVSSGNAVRTSTVVSATVVGTPTLTSFTAPQYSPPSYTLSALVATADSGYVGYRFYRGPQGNTSTLLADSTTNYKTVTPPSLPMQYWVRVYYLSSPTRCFAEAALTVP
jgi:YD repeat-containing protein